MRESQAIYAVYAPTSVEGTAYFLLDLYTEHGPIDFLKLKELYQKYWGSEGDIEKLRVHRVGPFRDLDELTHYIQDLCKELHSPYAYLMSVYDFNTFTENINEVGDFKGHFQARARKIDNPQLLGRKTPFFRRIFREA